MVRPVDRKARIKSGYNCSAGLTFNGCFLPRSRVPQTGTIAFQLRSPRSTTTEHRIGRLWAAAIPDGNVKIADRWRAGGFWVEGHACTWREDAAARFGGRQRALQVKRTQHRRIYHRAPRFGGDGCVSYFWRLFRVPTRALEHAPGRPVAYIPRPRRRSRRTVSSWAVGSHPFGRLELLDHSIPSRRHRARQLA